MFCPAHSCWAHRVQVAPGTNLRDPQPCILYHLLFSAVQSLVAWLSCQRDLPERSSGNLQPIYPTILEVSAVEIQDWAILFWAILRGSLWASLYPHALRHTSAAAHGQFAMSDCVRSMMFRPLMNALAPHSCGCNGMAAMDIDHAQDTWQILRRNFPRSRR